MTVFEEDLKSVYTSDSEFNLERVVPNDNNIKFLFQEDSFTIKNSNTSHFSVETHQSFIKKLPHLENW